MPKISKATERQQANRNKIILESLGEEYPGRTHPTAIGCRRTVGFVRGRVHRETKDLGPSRIYRLSASNVEDPKV